MSTVEKEFLNQYQLDAQRTECDQQKSLAVISSDINFVRMLHACIGMQSDFYELTTADSHTNVIEELGDLLWYVAEGVNACEENMGSLLCIPGQAPCSTYDQGVDSIRRGLSDMSYCLEKTFYYGQPFTKAVVMVSLARILAGVRTIASLHNWSWQQVATANINKLKQRFPDKYSAELAREENRSRDAEAEAITKSDRSY